MRWFACLFLSLLLLPALLADDRKPQAAARPWTSADVVFQDDVKEFQVSPDGRLAIWIHEVPDREANEQVGNLVRCNLETGRETILTRGKETCSQPRWSPDGKRIAFLRRKPEEHQPHEGSHPEGHVQLWLIDPQGGEAWPITESTRDILHFAWAGADHIIYVAQEHPSLEEKQTRSRQDDSQVVEEEAQEPPARLFRVDIPSGQTKRLTTNTDRIEWLAAAPDGRHVVACHSRSLRYVYDNRKKPAIILHDLDQHTTERVFAEPSFNIQHACWDPTGRGFYAVNLHNSRPQRAQTGIFELYYHELATGRAQRVDLGWDRGLTIQPANEEIPALIPLQDGFVALLASGVQPRAARYVRTEKGWQRHWLTGDHTANLFGLACDPDGHRLLYAHSTASLPNQWYQARLEGSRIEKPRPLAAINAHLESCPRAKTEVFRWPGAGAEQVEGILYHPHRNPAGKPAPLVVMIHGGPAAADFDCWDESWVACANLYCQRGAFVLRPNYHGSSEYGLEWMESITEGRYCQPELIDIEKGVEALVARGLVAPDRLALQGWSNGAILANQLTTRTTRYRASVSGAGSVEYVSDWASCDFGDAFDRTYLGKGPLDDVAFFQQKSPFYRLDRVRTPTLLFSGSEDRTVGTQQAWLHYRALQHLGKAPVRFVLFPGEKHVLEKPSHQQRKLDEEMAWMDRYLFETRLPTEPPLDEHSPLAWALKRRQASMSAARYGLLVGGKLIPETVHFGSVHIGRFEVTRAQLAEFDPAHPCPPGQENQPAGGISLEQARAYCTWLSRHTKKRYRLPTEEEAETVYATSADRENTLDHWAGQAVTPDDAARLRKEAAHLGEGAPLLRDVGSFRPVGDAGVFDLGGNVAEWVEQKDGSGILYGGSADTPEDARHGPVQAAPPYRGFRVLLAPDR